MRVAEAARALVERVFREESGQAVATLIRVLGDFDLAEEAVQEAFLVAMERWPVAGVPEFALECTLTNPSAPRELANAARSESPTKVSSVRSMPSKSSRM